MSDDKHEIGSAGRMVEAFCKSVAEREATLLAENKRLREALEKIAAFDDQFASARLERTGSYSLFDEPGSVAIARAALQGDTP